jgi:hypothetical protein
MYGHHRASGHRSPFASAYQRANYRPNCRLDPARLLALHGPRQVQSRQQTPLDSHPVHRHQTGNRPAWRERRLLRPDTTGGQPRLAQQKKTSATSSNPNCSTTGPTPYRTHKASLSHYKCCIIFALNRFRLKELCNMPPRCRCRLARGWRSVTLYRVAKDETGFAGACMP